MGVEFVGGMIILGRDCYFVRNHDSFYHDSLFENMCRGSMHDLFGLWQFELKSDINKI